MSDLYTKIHGTTTDRFKIGLKTERVNLSGSTTGNSTTTLTNRDNQNHTVNSTVFFTAYIVGQGTTNVAAYEIKGCYLQGTTTVTGYVTNTYVDQSDFTEPVVSFDTNGVMTVECTGVADDSVNWTASIDVVSI